ncbi:hypothetical protein BC628DRAFT_1361836, partial [Trametes gibbosa]
MSLRCKHCRYTMGEATPSPQWSATAPSGSRSHAPRSPAHSRAVRVPRVSQKWLYSHRVVVSAATSKSITYCTSRTSSRPSVTDTAQSKGTCLPAQARNTDGERASAVKKAAAWQHRLPNYWYYTFMPPWRCPFPEVTLPTHGPGPSARRLLLMIDVMYDRHMR